MGVGFIGLLCNLSLHIDLSHRATVGANVVRCNGAAFYLKSELFKYANISRFFYCTQRQARHICILCYFFCFAYQRTTDTLPPMGWMNRYALQIYGLSCLGVLGRANENVTI